MNKILLFLLVAMFVFASCAPARCLKDPVELADFNTAFNINPSLVCAVDAGVSDFTCDESSQGNTDIRCHVKENRACLEFSDGDEIIETCFTAAVFGL